MSQQEDFIAKIGPLCQKYAKKYGFKIASAAIAQACLESGYGTGVYNDNRNKVINPYTGEWRHNYFGMKYRPGRVNCHCGYFNSSGTEQHADGSYTPTTTDWYKFESLEKGVEGYYQFINISNYAKVKTATDPLTYLQEIKNAGYATSLNYVDNVYKVVQNWNLTKYDNFNNTTSETLTLDDKPASSLSTSSFINYTKLSPNNSGQRTHAIDRITPHCIVGQWDAATIGNYFAKPDTKASCNYGIAKDGQVVLVVEENKRSWCSSSNENDQRAVTIECSSEKTSPYAFNDAVYNKLIDLCVDICKRNGKNTLLWLGTKEASLNYNPKPNEMVLTVHRWFKQKACPGDWLMARMTDLATKVTNALKGIATTVTPTPVVAPTPAKNNFPYIVQITADVLNIRKGPGTNYPVVGQIKDKGKYTMMEEQNGFGLLKAYSGKRNGWISLKYTQKI